jgi:hypothetical protein
MLSLLPADLHRQVRVERDLFLICSFSGYDESTTTLWKQLLAYRRYNDFFVSRVGIAQCWSTRAVQQPLFLSGCAPVLVANGAQLVSATSECDAWLLCDLADGRIRVARHEPTDAAVRCMCEDPTTGQLVLLRVDFTMNARTLEWRRLPSLELVRSFPLTANSGSFVLLPPTGKLAAVAEASAVALWDTGRGERDDRSLSVILHPTLPLRVAGQRHLLCVARQANAPVTHQAPAVWHLLVCTFEPAAGSNRHSSACGR